MILHVPVRTGSPLRFFRDIEVLLTVVIPALVVVAVFATGDALDPTARAVALTDGMRAGFWVALISYAVMLGRYPLHLLSWARRILHVGVPAVGISVFVLVEYALFGVLEIETTVIALAAAIVARSIGSALARSMRAARPIRLAVIGSSEPAALLARELKQSGVDEYTVIGHVTLASSAPEQHADPGGSEPPCLGSLSDIRDLNERHVIDILVIGPRVSGYDVFSAVAEDYVGLPLRIIDYNALHEQLLGYVPLALISDYWFQYIMHPAYMVPFEPVGKRIVDLLVAVPLGVVCMPVVAVLALLVKASDRGSAFYRQLRIGAGGKEFEIVKLRTMRTNAQTESNPKWSRYKDPRVTSVGRLLRASHLDELPQLINVIRGDMSLVGPRPEQPVFIEELEHSVPFYSRRHLVRPGVTGWAQVRCGYPVNLVGTAWKMAHDLYYLKHRSPMFDLIILLETTRALAVGTQYDLYAPAQELILSRDDGPDT